MGINFDHGKNTCHHVGDTPRKFSSSVIVSDYHCEKWDTTLLPCVLNDINKLFCKAHEFQSASDQCMDEFHGMIFAAILQKKLARIYNINFGD